MNDSIEFTLASFSYKCNSQKAKSQMLPNVWNAFVKLAEQNAVYGKKTLFHNIFIVSKQGCLKLTPTDYLLSECNLKYRGDTIKANDERIASFSITVLHKHMNNRMETSKQLMSEIYEVLGQKILFALKRNKSLQINLPGVSKIIVIDKCYIIQKSSSSKTIIQKEQQNQYLLNNITNSEWRNKEEIIKNKTVVSQTKNNKMANQSRRQGENKSHRKQLHEQMRLSHFARLIPNDLLGAGLDPKAQQHTFSGQKQLLCDFVLQSKLSKRYPCIVDKFSRTRGCQQNGVKVSASPLVRIGSNYTPSARTLYITPKGIFRADPQVTLTLHSTHHVATQHQEYQFVTGILKGEQMQRKVQTRVLMYERYREYFTMVPNSSIAPLSEECVRRVVTLTRTAAREVGRNQGKGLIDSLLRQINTEYYKAGKTAVLEYILKDKRERVRTGIEVQFHEAVEWGQRQETYRGSGMEVRGLANVLQVNYHSPSLLCVVLENEKLSSTLSLQIRKQTEYKAYNVLHYLQKLTTQQQQLISYLNANWVRRVETVVERSEKGVHILLSNKLKELMYGMMRQTQDNLEKYRVNDRTVLMVSITEENEQIVYVDDIENSFRLELANCIPKMVQSTRHIVWKDKYLWSIAEEDQILQQTHCIVQQWVQSMYQKLVAYRDTIKKYQSLFKFKVEVTHWCNALNKQRMSLSAYAIVSTTAQQLQINLSFIHSDHWIDGVKALLTCCNTLQNQIIQHIPCFYKVLTVAIDCSCLRKRLLLSLRSTKKIIHQSVEKYLLTNFSTLTVSMTTISTSLVRPLYSTYHYTQLKNEIANLRSCRLGQLRRELEEGRSNLMKLAQSCSMSYQLLSAAYHCSRLYEELIGAIGDAQRRMQKEKERLAEELHKSIAAFVNKTELQLADISKKIKTFDLRKMYEEYLQVLIKGKQRVQQNKAIMSRLNKQQQDLQWSITPFISAISFASVVQPNYELWDTVQQFDNFLREHKGVQLHRFDMQSCEEKMMRMDRRIVKTMNKLKQLSAMKIASELQADIKEVLSQQAPIIKIFCNRGLKDRHWHLFNKKLPLAGYNLRQLTYARTKILYEHEKGLKVLTSISNQAAKEYEIEEEKNCMWEFWTKATFEEAKPQCKYPNRSGPQTPSPVYVIDRVTLQHFRSTAEIQLTRTIHLKNSPFSKALFNMLSEWEEWLIDVLRIVKAMEYAQEHALALGAVFRMEDAQQLLPIEATEYENADTVWKCILKKIIEQPKIVQFCRNQKMAEVLEEMGKKMAIIHKCIPQYLQRKRNICTRLYLISDQCLLQFIKKNNLIQSINSILPKIYNCTNIEFQDDSIKIRSTVDCLQLQNNKDLFKGNRYKIFEDLHAMEGMMKDRIRKEIREIMYKMTHKEQIQYCNYSLTSLLICQDIRHSTLDISLRKRTYQQQIKQLSQTTTPQYIAVRDCLLMKKLNNLQLIDSPSLIRWEYAEEQVLVHIGGRILNHGYQYQGDNTLPIYPAASLKHAAHCISVALNALLPALTTPYTATLPYLVANILGQPIFRIEKEQQAVCKVLTQGIITICIKEKEPLIKVLRQWGQLRNTSQTNASLITMVCLDHKYYQAIPKGYLASCRSIGLLQPIFLQKKLQLDKKSQISKKTFAMLCKIVQPDFNAHSFLCNIKEEEMTTKYKENIAKYLSQGQLYDQYFETKPKCKNKDKALELCIEEKMQDITQLFTYYDNVIIFGEQSYKSRLIKQYLTKHYSRDISHLITLDRIKGTQVQSYVNNVMRKIPDDIILHINGQLSSLQQFQSNQRIKTLIEMQCLAAMDPRSVMRSGKLHILAASHSPYAIYLDWCNGLPFTKQRMGLIQNCEHWFTEILTEQSKHQMKAQSRFIAANRLLSLFRSLLLYLNSTEVQVQSCFDDAAYIRNCFAMAAYWSISCEGVSKYLKSIVDIKYEDMYLDGEWCTWDNLLDNYEEGYSKEYIVTVASLKLNYLCNKLLAEGVSVAVRGAHKTTLIDRMCNVQDDCLVLDCNSNTNIYRLCTHLKSRLLYVEPAKRTKTHYVLVDDVHLAPQTHHIFRFMEDTNLLPMQCYEDYQQNYRINTQSHSNIPPISLLMTTNNYKSNHRLYSHCFLITSQPYTDQQWSYIFTAKIKNKQMVPPPSLLQTLLNVTHTFGLPIQQISNALCLCNVGEVYQKQTLLWYYGCVVSRVLDKSSIIKKLQLQSRDPLRQYVFSEMKQLLKRNECRGVKEALQAYYSEAKVENVSITLHHVRLIQRLYLLIRNNNNLIVKRQVGLRTTLKLACMLLNVAFVESTSLLQDVLKILKNGSKLDETFFLVEDNFQLVNQFLTSPEMYSIVTHIQMDKIIKAHNGDKKFIKKNIKKTELIQNIRDKLKQFVHFCILVDDVDQVKEYPKLIKECRYIQFQQWPVEAYTQINLHYGSIVEKYNKIGKIPNPFQINAICNELPKFKEKNLPQDYVDIWSQKITNNHLKIQQLLQTKATTIAQIQQYEANKYANQQKIIKQQCTLYSYLQQIESSVSQCKLFTSIYTKFEQILKSQQQHFPSFPSQSLENLAFSLLYNIQISPPIFCLQPADQIRFKYLIDNNNRNAVLTWLAVQLSEFYCVIRVNSKKNEVSLVRWLKQVSNKRVTVLNGLTLPKIKELIQKQGISVVYGNEHDNIFSELIKKRVQSRGCNKIFLLGQNECNLVSKVIFVVDNNYRGTKVKNTVWRPQYQEQCLGVYLSKAHQQNQVIVNEYLKAMQQLCLVDSKMHAIILKMKKQNCVSEVVFKKIQDQGQAKIKLEQTMTKCKNTLTQIIQARNQQTYKRIVQFNICKDLIISIVREFKEENIVYSICELITNKTENFQTQSVLFKMLCKKKIIITTQNVYLVQHYIKKMSERNNIQMKQNITYENNEDNKKQTLNVLTIKLTQDWKIITENRQIQALIVIVHETQFIPYQLQCQFLQIRLPFVFASLCKIYNKQKNIVNLNQQIAVQNLIIEANNGIDLTKYQ